MIPEILDHMSNKDVMYLINALAFEAARDDEYSESQVRDGKFTNTDGSVKTVDFMHGTENLYLEHKNATGFIK